ncbi:DUF4942 domain-containing protein [Citrobacter meridianamericanus]
MASAARDKWSRNLEWDDIPAINEENIISTFKPLHCSRDKIKILC